MKKLRVLLADDHKVVRDGLRLLIDGQQDMRVVGEAGNGKEALRQARDLKPDVVVMDLSMPELNGLQATERLKAERPEIKVVALTVHEDPSYLVQLCKAGAVGYVLKRSAGDDLIQAIRTVAGGGAALRPDPGQQGADGPAGGIARQRRAARQRLERAGKGSADPAGLGLQQQGNRRQPRSEHQDRRNLPGPHQREARPAQPDRDRAIRFAARVVERRIPASPVFQVVGIQPQMDTDQHR